MIAFKFPPLLSHSNTPSRTRNENEKKEDKGGVIVEVKMSKESGGGNYRKSTWFSGNPCAARLKKWVARSGPGEREKCWRGEKLRGTPKVTVNRCLWSRLIASRSRASRQPSQRSLREAAHPGFSFVFSSFPLLPLSTRPIPVSLSLSSLPLDPRPSSSSNALSTSLSLSTEPELSSQGENPSVLLTS